MSNTSQLHAMLKSTGMDKDPQWVLALTVMNGNLDFPECAEMLAALTKGDDSLLNAFDQWNQIAVGAFNKAHRGDGCSPGIRPEGLNLDGGGAAALIYCQEYWSHNEDVSGAEPVHEAFRPVFSALPDDDKVSATITILSVCAALVFDVLQEAGYQPGDIESLLNAMKHLG